MIWEWTSDSPAATSRLARCLGGLLRGGEVLCLAGDLGAGKTLFTQGVAAGLEVAGEVTSPTFALLNIYQSRLGEVYHFDLYRLEDASQLWDIDFYSYVEGRGVALVEWPDAFWEEMPREHLRIELCRGEGEEQRRLRFLPHGERYETLCEELKQRAGLSD